jgi:hypothetical protein
MGLSTTLLAMRPRPASVEMTLFWQGLFGARMDEVKG